MGGGKVSISSPQMTDPGSRFGVKRAGLARLLFAIFRSGDARAASVNADSVELAFGSRSADIALGDIGAVEVKAGRRWGGVRLCHAGTVATVSGLSRSEARALADAVERTRTDWWRRRLAPQIGVLRSVHDRLTCLADPPGYVRSDAVRELVQEAQAVAGGLVGHWPDSLSEAQEIRMLRGILEFLEAPEDARSRANKAFVANEPVRSRDLFDRIEARPLTDEQRKAVVVDEKCNLVVAAAGSGKTSVIVAKAGWLLRRGYRKPSELLLLAFARDARNEMEERIRKRLGAGVAKGVTVRTFHSLGMAIIGEAEGKRPALARSAETDRALFDVLKGIVADLLADGALSETVLEWFQDQFAPYRSAHEFPSWGAYWNYIRRNDIRSLKGDEVRSYEECEIANFLYLNGVAYEYEAPYEHETATAEKRQYKPDFHLPDHGIYIEHFGVDAEGNTAPFSDRLANPLTGAQVTVGGQTVNLAEVGDEAWLGQTLTSIARAMGAPSGPAPAHDPGSGSGTGGWPGTGLGGVQTAVPGSSAPPREITGRELLLGSAFHLVRNSENGGPGLAAWGRVTTGGFDGEETTDSGTMRIDGSVTTGILGADAQWNRLLGGVAISVSEGEGSFAQPGVDSGKIESTMTTVSPYARFMVTDRVSVWGLAGWGTGDMTIVQDARAATDTQAARDEMVTRTDAPTAGPDA